jgi:hypothetical protein
VIDLLRALVTDLETLAKARLQHLQPAYIAEEKARLLVLADEINTARQLEKYGVEYGTS